MIQRTSILSALNNALSRSRVVVLVGPRQSGKTTLARELLEEDSVNYFDLENPASLARLDEPMTALKPLNKLIIINKIQRQPNLFPILRILTNHKNTPARFLQVKIVNGIFFKQLAGECGFTALARPHKYDNTAAGKGII